jgi:hypothetical protein
MQQSIKRAASAAFLSVLLVGGAAVASNTLREPQDAKKPAVKQDAKHDAKQDTKTVDLSPIDSVGETCWADLRTKRFYFAHEALGSEITKGVETILSRKPEIGLKVFSFRQEEREAKGHERRGESESPAFDRPGVFHAVVGNNGEPEDKIDAFEEFLLSPEGAKIDVALLKLSCADFGRSTDAARVVDRYAQAVDSIRAARPNLRIVHCTAPLREIDHGAKGTIKKMFGAGTDAANATRGRFNDLLRKRFANDVIFDVARAESTRLDGTEETVVVKNEHWPALASEFGEGAHDLTEAGRSVLGREFLLALSRCCAEAKVAKPTVTAAPTGVTTAED